MAKKRKLFLMEQVGECKLIKIEQYMLQTLINEGRSFEQNPEQNFAGNPMWVNQNNKNSFFRWEMQSLLYLQQEYRDVPMVADFKSIIDRDRNFGYLRTLHSLIGILEAFDKIQPKVVNTNYDSIIRGIIEHFNACALQLRRRHAGRETLTINDEYDVQDLLHALLKLHFFDVRPEEWTPSYAGNSNRMDFLLKEAHIAIEVKMTRDNLKDKEIGEQLIIDIAKYQQHPDVNKLYCFVYDPNAILHNPVGLENDLNKLSTDNFSVNVFVRPI